MEGVSEVDRRKIIGSFYQKHWSMGKSYTYKYFSKLGISKATIYRVMEKMDKGESLARKAGSGRKAEKMTSRKVRVMKRYMKENLGASQRKAALKFGVSLAYVNKIVRTKTKLSYRRRKRVPGATEEQKKKQKQRCSRLIRNEMKAKNKAQIIMDDESYFFFKGNNQPGNRGFYSDDIGGTGDGVRYASADKFTPKVMVWVAFSEHAISQPFFLQRGAMDSDTYRTKCLPKLQKFVQDNYRGQKVIFWPDLASAHYQKDVLKTLADMKIPVVAKADNPPATPQIRPIERLWALLKARLYAGGFEAQTKDQLIARIRRELAKVTAQTCQNLWRNIRKNIWKVADGGHAALLTL